MQHLRSLWRLRSRLVGEQTRYKNRIKGHLALYGHPVPPTRSAWSGVFLKALEEIEFVSEAGRCYLDHCLEGLRQVHGRIARLMRELRQYVEAIDNENIVTRLKGVPGIGAVGAIAFYCEVIDIHRFARFDELCSYVGFVPATHSSGEREDSGRLTWRGNRYLRTVLVEAAWMAVGKDPALTQAYVRLKKRMKPQQAIPGLPRNYCGVSGRYGIAARTTNWAGACNRDSPSCCPSAIRDRHRRYDIATEISDTVC